ncbi:hypothetical protein [Roseovarius autotrophicus]|uniref:hypothetical protein n=1 Tax=Roseovarius autotrophicus TaxID=2824121 RepID=UPI0019DE456B|nr:hypothetical protein [Roseovarius autotrophicus]MBE0454514.1 hypothetical protein [Roseovarius sp.]
MTALQRHIRPLGAVLCLAALAACARDSEAAQRGRLATWVSLGQTLSFSARRDCAVGVYAVVTGAVKAALPLTDSAPAMRRALEARGVAALALAGQGGDAALLAITNHDRATGMAMRRAALEARACMDQAAEGRFRGALDTPGTIVGWDAGTRSLMLMRPDEGWLMLVQGEG